MYGAGDRDRTGTDLVSPRDFKSLASANSATPASCYIAELCCSRSAFWWASLKLGVHPGGRVLHILDI